ncbi:glycosyltransferase [Bifidobacterium saguini DSM 23967]|uniref:Glycosyltransferase n=2 Tax=Bifidobacterium saguini TaxID=762210 RepID=A0A087D916_9BIFI|nr:glycosyltransferase [Bifidobacterium saguini]KFI92016.1 glycosyltransferase [Bifidobacterium saguini DSM 23967]QTB90251.1 glycosyltransferase [Bifidobacterium saguini]
MKIVEVMPEFGLAGAQRMAESLILGLSEAGHQVYAISLFSEETSITENLHKHSVPVYFLGKKAGLDLSIFIKVFKVLKTIQPDVVHTHRYCMQYVIPAAQLLHIKVKVHTVHNIAEKEVPEKQQKLNNWFYHHCDVVPVAISPVVQKSIVNRYHLQNNDVPLIYNGVTRNYVHVANDCDIFNFLNIARFEPQKNHRMLIESFKKVHDVHPKTRLTLVGDYSLGGSNAEYNAVIALIKQYKLEDSVELVGAVDDVAPYVERADAFVLPSRYEGFPITLIEAFCAGLPVVCTAVGGVPDIVSNEENGLLTSVDAGEFAHAMIRLVEDDNLRMTLSEHAQRDSRKYSQDSMTDAYQVLFEKLIAR